MHALWWRDGSSAGHPRHPTQGMVAAGCLLALTACGCMQQPEVRDTWTTAGQQAMASASRATTAATRAEAAANRAESAADRVEAAASRLEERATQMKTGATGR